MSFLDSSLSKSTANYVPLSPVSFLRRTAHVYPDRAAIVHGAFRQSWIETWRRCCSVAAGLKSLGVRKNDAVAMLAANIPAAVEAAFSVPMSGGVLTMLNYRLDASAIAFQLDHSEAKVFFVDAEFTALAKQALALSKKAPVVVEIESETSAGGWGHISYSGLANHSYSAEEWEQWAPEDEWDAIALNYTSGTTGNPKGVVYHHRGAYLNALGNGVEWALPHHPVYLWTLPIFHANGWCFPWTIAAYAGTNICIRETNPVAILDAIEAAGVTHFSGAPIVLSMLLTEAAKRGKIFSPQLKATVAGAPPPPSVLERAQATGIDVNHVYGLTEVYGPTAVCAWKDEWNHLSEEEQAALRARQGVNYVVLEELSVRDPKTMLPVPKDGKTMGEIMFRGNVVMKGYLKNPKATAEAFEGGHFHSGDLAVWHPDGYVDIRDRSKDIIISGGENISSIEVEAALYKHPAVRATSVVAAPHPKWGETPWAFVECADDATVSEEELISFCRQHLAHFKCPTRVLFEAIPKTSTGKIQKFELRARARARVEGT